MPPIQTAWAASIALKTVLAFAAPWRLFRAFLIFCVIGSLLSWWVAAVDEPLYSTYITVWTVKALILCVWNAALVVDACSRLPARVAGSGYAASATVALGIGWKLARSPRWPNSHLETGFAWMAIWSTFLAFVMVLALVRALKSAVWLPLGYSAILTAYLLFDALNLFPASEFIDRIGISTGISTSVCYLAWIVLFFCSQKTT